MRTIPFILSALATTALVIALNTPLPVGGSKTPRLGYFLSPQQGFWQNAESANASFSGEVKIKGLKNKVDVYMDERLVPHIYAENDLDAYYVQGFLHAKFRLWQKFLNGSFTILPGILFLAKKVVISSIVLSVDPVSQIQ